MGNEQNIVNTYFEKIHGEYGCMCRGRKNKIVIVELGENSLNNKYLPFIVEDTKNAECPGSPAMTLEYYNDLEKLKKDIIFLYNVIGKPKSTKEIEFYRSKIRKRGGN
jgi:hypothetical protein